MYKFFSFVLMSLITCLAFAKPCSYTVQSCLKLKNDSNALATIQCNGLEQISAPNKSQSSVQLNLAFGDGLGEPEPRSMYCQITVGDATNPFNFYNPYWGSVIIFHLKTENSLSVTVTEGKRAHTKTEYEFNW
jgi:hypothetical protein